MVYVHRKINVVVKFENWNGTYMNQDYGGPKQPAEKRLLLPYNYTSKHASRSVKRYLRELNDREEAR